MEAGGDYGWVVRCSSDVLAPELVVNDLAVGLLVDDLEGSVVRGYHVSVNEGGSLQVGEVRDDSWGQVEVASRPGPFGSVFLRINGGARQTANENGCNETRQ